MKAAIKVQKPKLSQCEVGKQHHYTQAKIQPIEYIMANNLSFLEGNIVKRITRYKHKDGVKDLQKIIVECNFLINAAEGRNPLNDK